MTERPTLADIRERAGWRVDQERSSVTGPDPAIAALLAALDAVLALHQEHAAHETSDESECDCAWIRPGDCEVCWEPHPCATVRAIESVIDLGGER